jgi:hypothetical protein
MSLYYVLPIAYYGADFSSGFPKPRNTQYAISNTLEALQ